METEFSDVTFVKVDVDENAVSLSHFYLCSDFHFYNSYTRAVRKVRVQSL
jgi:hypothetical protein